MAKGIGAVVPWEPSATIIEERKTGREVDTIYPYNFYEGMFDVRQELIDNVPDVVQAICDALHGVDAMGRPQSRQGRPFS